MPRGATWGHVRVHLCPELARNRNPLLRDKQKVCLVSLTKGILFVSANLRSLEALPVSDVKTAHDTGP